MLRKIKLDHINVRRPAFIQTGDLLSRLLTDKPAKLHLPVDQLIEQVRIFVVQPKAQHDLCKNNQSHDADIQLLLSPQPDQHGKQHDHQIRQKTNGCQVRQRLEVEVVHQIGNPRHKISLHLTAAIQPLSVQYNRQHGSLHRRHGHRRSDKPSAPIHHKKTRSHKNRQQIIVIPSVYHLIRPPRFIHIDRRDQKLPRKRKQQKQAQPFFSSDLLFMPQFPQESDTGFSDRNQCIIHRPERGRPEIKQFPHTSAEKPHNPFCRKNRRHSRKLPCKVVCCKHLLLRIPIHGPDHHKTQHNSQNTAGCQHPKTDKHPPAISRFLPQPAQKHQHRGCQHPDRPHMNKIQIDQCRRQQQDRSRRGLFHRPCQQIDNADI